MPSIELEGESDARFVLKDGKIVRADSIVADAPRLDEEMRLDERSPKRPDSF